MKKTLLIFTTACLATTSSATDETKETFTSRVGRCEVTVISEGQGDGDRKLLIGATPQMTEETMPEGTYPTGTNVFLIRVMDETILIDAGYGRRLFDNLDVLGVPLNGKIAIFLTHMHGDHIGGLIRDGKRAFPNAGLALSQKEYEYWTSREEYENRPEDRRGSFDNARRVLELYTEQEHFSVYDIDSVPEGDGIFAVEAFGHTPGHTAYMLRSEGEELLIWGDLTHAMAIQMPYPRVALTYDVDPQKAIESRLRILEHVVENDIPVAGMHVPYPGIGRVERNGKGGYRFIPALQ